MLISCLIAAPTLLAIYLAWKLWYQNRQIKHMVDYVQNLKNRIYDLKIQENREGELSILSNELYKIVVLLREAADQNQKARENLETALADISHQLRTPLTSLGTMLDNIYDDPEMPPAIRQDFLRASSRQIQTMSELVTTLLNLAKFDNGVIKLKQETVTAGKLLHQVAQNLAVLADLQDVQMEITGDLNTKIKADLRWQTEALTNIVKNCLEHSAAGNKVILRAENYPLYLKITIRDFGEGIAPADLKRIFERFYRAPNATPGSVGIGLAFAKTIIEAAGGQIKARSKLGEGTEFVVTYFK